MVSSIRRTALVTAVVLAAAAPVRADVDIERVSFTPSADGQTIVARIHTTDRVRAYSVDQDGDDVSLVVYEAELADRVRRGDAQAPVESYRLEAGDNRVTLRFDVDPSATVRAYPDRDSDDLLVAFSAGGPASGQMVSIEPQAPIVRTSAPASADAERWLLDTIVLDAGHGDRDWGARANGTSDKEVGLAVVLRLGRMIERELPGVRVVYTRDDDTFIPLPERGRIANREGGKLFISVHANAARNTSAYGTETFFLALRGDPSAREVMLRENRIVGEEMDPELYDNHADEGGDILQAMALSAYREESLAFALLVEREFAASGRRSRGVKQENFEVLRTASMPAVLVEVGFITNREEAEYLKSERGLDQTARSIFNAVRDYKEIYERGLQ
ncbi:MAG: N-acetylmuramoyl-L-alanine amidase [Bacteroidota bacterium]